MSHVYHLKFCCFSVFIVVLGFFLLVGCDRSSEDGGQGAATKQNNTTAPHESIEQHGNNAHRAEKTSSNSPPFQDEFGPPEFEHDNIILLEQVAEIPPTFGAELDRLFSMYLIVAAAFIPDATTTVETAAKNMRSALEGLHPKGLSAEAAKAWSNHQGVLMTALDQITSSPSLEEKRKHLNHISKAMFCTLASFGRPSEAAYLLYCPKALNNAGGYWLADTKEITNPYLSAKGLRCGEVQHEF